MALVPCPACGLPRATADADTACPACRWDAPAPPPPAPEPAPEPPPPPPTPPRPRRALAGALGVAVGVVATLAVQSALPRPVPESAPEPAPEVAAAPVYPRVPSLPVAPPPRAVEPGGPLVLPVPVPFPVDGGFAVLRVDQPDEMYAFPKLGPGNRVRLTGRVKKLTVDGLAAGAELDASGLATEGVSVTEAVEGGVLRVTADGGTVAFRRGVSGGAVVEVLAPKSYLALAQPTGAKASVGGGARLTVRVKSAEVAGPVAGAGTVFDLTLSRGGSMRLAAVEDGALVRYRPDHRSDPPLRVTPGRVSGGELREEEQP